MTSSTPWTDSDKRRWFAEQRIKRSYSEQVIPKIQALKSAFEVTQYGSLSLDPVRYPLFLVHSKKTSSPKKIVLITGGVHGYETSGVHGALAFMEREARAYESEFHLICAPCISPWAYETINRWTPKAIDPNRSFVANSPVEECSLFLNAISPFLNEIYVHIDLHETTDTDNTVFRPAQEARDGKSKPWSEIPDGFYTVGDTRSPCPEFQKAVIDSVRQVTHIAPPDADGNIIGEKLEQEGVINYDKKRLSLCGGISNAKYITTTEVYPDSPKVTDEICIEAQVAAVRGGLNYVISTL